MIPETTTNLWMYRVLWTGQCLCRGKKVGLLLHHLVAELVKLPEFESF